MRAIIQNYSGLFLYLQLPITQLLMPCTPVFCVSLLCLSLNAFSQQQQPVPPNLVKPLVDSNKTFAKVEIEASFPGGQEAWVAYLTKNLKANTPVKKKAPAGRYTVIVRFIVAKDGNISDIAAETSHGYGMEAEVRRIILKGPRWNPAIQDGRAISAYRRQPVTFVVEGK